MAFLQDDDDAFEAALSFLDEYAASASVAGGLSPDDRGDGSQDAEADDSQAAALGAKRARPEARQKHQLSDEEKERRRVEFNERRKLLRKAGVYGNANKARNERAREIAFLKDETEKLQIDLQILKTRRCNETLNLGKKGGNCNALAEEDTGSQITSMWQGLADQQRRRRQEAERDNLLLRLAIKRQRTVASNLTRQMQRRATQLVWRQHCGYVLYCLLSNSLACMQTNECASLITTVPSKHHTFNVLDFRGDLEGFRGLFHRLDDAYRNMDNVFMMNGLAGMTVPPIDVHIHKHADGKSIEFASYKVLPFDVRATAEATWNHFKGVEKHLAYGNLYEKAEKVDFKKELYSNTSRADIKVKQVIRRYVEEDRDVVIWASRAVPIEIKHKIHQGLTYHLRGYSVTKRSSESTPDREISVLQFCYLVSLDQDVDVHCDPANLQALVNFLVATLKRNIPAHREHIENALIDQSLARRKYNAV
ncbi:unnamed protein product [Phytophthora fragariaefolia]|uniref:Unnamed protein product n=1 Tax=Phytophthora fragariaefolia TaxID=1490495 RepID=A0A9W6U716_9STRA|nr:unnamed protein product [Phytophthora fragariaefolia]